MKELFIKEVVDRTNDFLDNNQRIKLKELLIEICFDYQIEIIKQTKKQETQKNNKDFNTRTINFNWYESWRTYEIKYIRYEFSGKKLYCFRKG